MNRYLRYIILTNSVFSFAEGLFVPLYALFVIEIGGSIELAGVLYGTKFLTVTLVELVIIRMKDRIKIGEKMLKINYLMRGCAWLSLIFFPFIPFLFLTQIVIGFSDAIGTPAMNSLISEHLDKKKHIHDWGYSMLIGNTAVALASILSGYIATFFGFNALFAMMACLALIAFLMLQFRPKVNQTVSEMLDQG